MATDQLSTTFAALADPTRREILARLTEGSKTVTELAEPFDMTMPAISKHLNVLERARLIERSRNAQFRPASLRHEPLQQVDAWLAKYRDLFESSFDRLDDYLKELQSEGEG